MPTLKVGQEVPCSPPGYRFCGAGKERWSMLTTLTAKLKLTTSPEQFKALRTTQLTYRDALNQVSQYAFAHGKSSSRRRLQRDLYGQIRRQRTLPAQMACSVFRQVGARNILLRALVIRQDWMARGSCQMPLV